MKLKKFLPYFILTTAIMASYWNCLHNEFVWDDEFLIEKNSYLRSFEHLPKMLTSNSTAGFGGVDNFYRPTQNIYYLFIFQAFGYNKVAFHLGNLLLHLLNALLLLTVLTRILDSRAWAFSSSLLWAIHPTHVEAIGYISGTADPMGLLFFLMGLWMLPFKDFRKNSKALFLAWIFFTLSLLSKEAMIVAPALLVLVLAYKNPTTRWSLKTYIPTLPFWLVAVVYMGLRKTVLNFNETYSFYKSTNIYTENMIYRVYTYLATLPDYLEILFWPVDLHMERKFPVHTEFTSAPVLAGFAIVALSLGPCLWFYFKRKTAWPLFSWLWFFAAFVPMMGILVPVNSFILEHWLYLPSIGFFIVVGFWLKLDWQSLPKKLRSTVLVLICLFLMAFTHIRNRDWATPITFYGNILEHSQGSARVHNNLAMAYSEKKEFNKAIPHYLKAIELADTYPQTHYNLARAYIQTNQLQKAKTHLKRSLEIKPDFSYSKRLLIELETFLGTQKSSE